MTVRCSLTARAQSGLVRAIEALGGQSALGRIIGKNQSTVHDWVRKQKPLPAEHVLTVEAATGISRHELRPDLYPVEDTAPSAGIAPDRLEGVRP